MPYINDTFHLPIIADKYYAGLDYLRLTRQTGLGVQFTERIPHWIEYLQTFGYEAVPYSIFNLRGWLLGKLAYLKNEDTECIEFRGDLADSWHVHYLHLTSKCTRIDLAITVWLTESDDTIARQLYMPALAMWQKDGQTKNRKAPVLYQSEDGDTLYLGSRTSRRYVRIYNKAKQSTDLKYRNAWRFELEAKGDLAQVLWQRIQARETIASLAVQEIAGSLLQYGIRLPFSPDEVKLTKVITDLKAPSIDAKLSWLSRQVRPTVRELIQKGHLQEVLEALDIHPE